MYFLEDRELYGISANTSVGNWAVGAEVVVSAGCGVARACTEDNLGGHQVRRLPSTGATPVPPHPASSAPAGDHGWFLDLVGAQTAPSLGEAVAIASGVKRTKVYTRTRNGVTYQQLPAAGAWTHPTGVGDKLSWGYMFDFSLTYDSTLIPGW